LGGWYPSSHSEKFVYTHANQKYDEWFIDMGGVAPGKHVCHMLDLLGR
jgi:hypothetical protein